MTRKCDHCGLLHVHGFKVEVNGRTYFFDTFECAILQVAPRCDRCGTPIRGHGIEQEESLFCSAACAEGADGLP